MSSSRCGGTCRRGTATVWVVTSSASSAPWASWRCNAPHLYLHASGCNNVDDSIVVHLIAKSFEEPSENLLISCARAFSQPSGNIATSTRTPTPHAQSVDSLPCANKPTVQSAQMTVGEHEAVRCHFKTHHSTHDLLQTRRRASLPSAMAAEYSLRAVRSSGCWRGGPLPM